MFLLVLCGLPNAAARDRVRENAAAAVASAANKPETIYTLTLRDHSPMPVVSLHNAPGQGRSLEGCISFNPSFIPASPTFNMSGILLRLCCGKGCIGHGRSKSEVTAEAPAERIGFAPCDVETGLCSDVLADFNLDPTADAEDPRAILYNGMYYNFYYRQAKGGGCTGPECTVQLAKTATPLNASSWQAIGTFPWHRNGCCAMRPKGERSYCIWGEGPGPFQGLGISYTEDIDSGIFVQDSWLVGPGVHSPLSNDSRWLLPLGGNQEEIKLEAGTHMVKLSTGDWVHFYAAATPGWVENGNYTAGYLVLDKDDPRKILQRQSGQWLVPFYDYETLCGGASDCPFTGERKNVIFLCSATPMQAKDTFRLFFGGGDGNVGTAVVEVTY